MKKESLSLIVKDLLIDIVDLVSLYKFDNIEIVVHQSFSFLKQFVLFFSLDILERVAFTAALAAKTTSAETLNYSVNHVFEIVGP